MFEVDGIGHRISKREAVRRMDLFDDTPFKSALVDLENPQLKFKLIDD